MKSIAEKWETGIKKTEIISDLECLEVMDLVDVIYKAVEMVNKKFRNTVLAKETKKTLKLRIEVEFECLEGEQ